MTQVSISVPHDIRAYLEIRAERHGLSLEMLLRQAVELYLRAADRMPRRGEPLKRIGPYSKAFRNGSLGDDFDGRSREGKFLRKFEAEMVAQLGGSPTFAQLALLRRASRTLLQL